MRQVLFAVGVIVILNAVTHGADKAEPRVIIDKAIKALGGADNIIKFQGTKVRTKGRVDARGGIDFTQELLTRLPDEYKESLRLDIGGKTITLVTVFDGKKGWVSTNGNVTEAEGKVLGDMKEAAYMLHITNHLIQDKGVKLTPLGDARVEGRDTVGVRISVEGQRDMSIYFDKTTGLPAKMQYQVYDLQSKKDVNEERIIQAFTEVSGLKVPKKVVVNRDGKKFMDIELVEAKMLENIDKKEFVKP